MKPKSPTTDSPQPPAAPQADQPRDQGYYASIGHNGSEDEITIHAPDDRPMAGIRFWTEEFKEPGVLDKEAQAESKLIVGALNAYQPPPASHRDSNARTGATAAYHVGSGCDPYDIDDALNICAPDGRAMAYLPLDDQPNHAKADAQRIVDALNAYPPAQQYARNLEHRRVESFHAYVASCKDSSHYFEEMDGDHRTWAELSAEGKLSYLAQAAAIDDVPYEHFAKAVQNVLGDQPPPAREETALRLLLTDRRDLHTIAKLVPDDPHVTFPPPLVDRMKSLLNWYEDRLKKLEPYENLGNAVKQLASDVVASDPDVFARNGHRSANDSPPKIANVSSAPTKKPERNRNR